MLFSRDKMRYMYRVFTKEQVDCFLNSATYNLYLMMKVVLILGVAGACRCDELVDLTIDNVEDVKSALIIKISNTKTKRPHSITVLGDNYLSFYRKYVALCPPELVECQLFLRYVSGKCHQMVVVGIHKISAVSQEVAKFLKLNN